MNKKTCFLLLLLAFFKAEIKAQSASSGQTQSNAFIVAAKNKKWTISKYLITATQEDKKSLFTNTVLDFGLADSSYFLIVLSGSDTLTGQWTLQYDNNVRLLLPTSSNLSHSAYNEGASSISSWPLKEIEFQPSVLKFKMDDMYKGEILIELTQKL